FPVSRFTPHFRDHDLARKSKARKGRRRSGATVPWLWIGAAAVLIGVVLVFTHQQRPSLVLRGKDLAEQSPAPEREAPSRPAEPSSDGKSEEASVQLLTSDWVKLKLRTESEFLRLFRSGDPAALNRLTSRTLRGALEQAGVSRDMIDERPGTVAAAGVGHAP